MGERDSLLTAIAFVAVGLWVLLDALPVPRRGRWTLLARIVAIAAMLPPLFSIDVRIAWPLRVETSAAIFAALFAFGLYNAGRRPERSIISGLDDSGTLRS